MVMYLCIQIMEGFLIQQLALRAAPTYENFTAAFATREGDELKGEFINSMHRDLDLYLPAMEKQLAILDELYEEYNLESDEVVWNSTEVRSGLKSARRRLMDRKVPI